MDWTDIVVPTDEGGAELFAERTWGSSMKCFV